MTPTKLLVLIIFSIVSISLILVVLNFLQKKYIKKDLNFVDDNVCQAISSGGILISMAIIFLSAIKSTLISLDTIMLTNSKEFYFETSKIICINIGLGFLWFFLWYFVIRFLSNILFIKVDERQQVDNNNISYFLINAILLFTSFIINNPVFDEILKMFTPSITLPIFH